MHVTDGVFMVADVSNPADPAIISELTTPGGWYGGVAVSGNYAYHGTRDSGFLVIDITDPNNPFFLATYDPGNDVEIEDVYLDADLAFLSENQRGFEILDISVPSNPQSIAVIDPPGDGYVSDIIVYDNHCIVADKSEGFHIYNIENPASPVFVVTVDTPNIARRLAISGTILYVADENGSGLRIYGISDIANPQFELALDCGNATAVTISGDRAYVVDCAGSYIYGVDRELVVLDITDTDAPVEIGREVTGGAVFGVEIVGDFAFVADANNTGLKIYDISSPTSPLFISSCDYTSALGMDLKDNYAYLADYGKMQIVDFLDPNNPIRVAEVSFPGLSFSIVARNDYAYIADINNSIRVVDISDPTDPAIVTSVDLNDYARAVAIQNSFLYAANENDGLAIIDMTDPTSPVYIKNIDVVGKVRGVATFNNRCYFTDNDGMFHVADISTPSEASIIGSYDIGLDGENILLDGNYTYVGSDGRDGIAIVNIADPFSVFVTHRIDTKGFAKDIAKASSGEIIVADYFAGLAIIED